MRRPVGSLLAVARLGVPVVAAPAAAEDAPPPAVVNEHDSTSVRSVVQLAAGPAGVLAVELYGLRAHLLRSPVTTATAPVDLGRSGPLGILPYPRPSLSGTRVALPTMASLGVASGVRSCAVAACPATTALPMPEGYRYLGNADDAAVLYSPTDKTVALAPWDGGEPVLVPVPDLPAPVVAGGDASGVVLSGNGRVSYLARPSLTLTQRVAHHGYLTPSYVVTYRPLDEVYVIERVARATPDGEAELVAARAKPPHGMVATDAGVAWVGGAESRTLYTVAYGGDVVEGGAVELYSIAPSPDGTAFLTHRDGPQGRGFYATVPGTATSTLTAALPPVPATTRSFSLSHGRAAFTDDSGPSTQTAFVRDVTGGVPGAETGLGPATSVVVSGPYAVTAHDNGDGTFSLNPHVAGGPSSISVPGTSNSALAASGHRALVTNDARSAVVDLRTGAVRDLGDVTAALFGDVVVTADRTGRILRRNLATGALQQVRAGSATACGSLPCDRSRWRLAAWSGDVVYDLDLGSNGRATALWTPAGTTPLPMVTAATRALAYWDGLLLVGRTDTGLTLHDLAAGTAAVVDATATSPSVAGLDGTVVAWSSAAHEGRPVVRPVTAFLPSYVPRARYTGAVVPPGFGPGLNPGSWRPVWHLSQDVPWQVQIRRGGATGPVVRTLSGTTDRGLVAPVWDGKTATGAAAPHGSYTWTLAGGAPARTGTVFLSRVAPPTPTITAPELVSDVTTGHGFRLTWRGAPAGHRYVVTRSVDGHYWQPVTTTTATGMTAPTWQNRTYRFRVRVQDPAGRLSGTAMSTTVSPRDDRAGDPLSPATYTKVTDSRAWQGTLLRGSRAYDRVSFTLRGTKLYLVGNRGPMYGRLRIHVDGREYVVDAYAPAKAYRQVLFTVSGLTDDFHSFTVETLPTPGRTLVDIDGAGARKGMWVSPPPP